MKLQPKRDIHGQVKLDEKGNRVTIDLAADVLGVVYHRQPGNIKLLLKVAKRLGITPYNAIFKVKSALWYLHDKDVFQDYTNYHICAHHSDKFQKLLEKSLKERYDALIKGDHSVTVTQVYESIKQQAKVEQALRETITDPSDLNWIKQALTAIKDVVLSRACRKADNTSAATVADAIRTYIGNLPEQSEVTNNVDAVMANNDVMHAFDQNLRDWSDDKQKELVTKIIWEEKSYHKNYTPLKKLFDNDQQAEVKGLIKETFEKQILATFQRARTAVIRYQELHKQKPNVSLPDMRSQETSPLPGVQDISAPVPQGMHRAELLFPSRKASVL